MVKTLVRASVVETTLDIQFAIAELPTQTVGAQTVSDRNVVVHTITLSASVALNDETITVSALPVALDAGTKLIFGATTLTVGQYKSAGSTSIPILPAPGTAASAATATTVAWRFCIGATNCTIKPEIKNVETTNYLSGTGKEQVTTGNSKMITLEFNDVLGDQGGNLLKKVIFDGTAIGREYYFQLIFKTGEKHEGVLLLTSASPTQAVQDKRSFQCDAQIQGSSYIYTPSTAIIVGGG